MSALTTLDPGAMPMVASQRRDLLLASLAQRAARWAWREVYLKVRRGETVRPYHRGMMELTLRRIAGQLKRQEDDHG